MDNPVFEKVTGPKVDPVPTGTRSFTSEIVI